MSANLESLVERSHHLDILGDLLQRALDGSGRLVVISGEAGIGKTSLLRKFISEQKEKCGTYWGSCDALSTPRPLGPLQDMAVRIDAGLPHLLNSGGDPNAIFSRVLAAIEAHAKLPIVVFEDVHWADRATLDLIKFLGRRITSLRALILLSVRSDETAHPISRILSEVPSASVQRMDISPLSLSGVRELANGTDFDAQHLHRITAGNPFFVRELISAGSDTKTLPASIKDALRTLRLRLRKSSNAALEVASIFPAPPSDWILARMIGKTSTRALEECMAVGLLARGETGELRFRHELARLAVLEDLLKWRQRSLHAKAVVALNEARAAGHQVESALLMHHVASAGDGREVIRLAPLAAAESARVGAHAQAAEHLATALSHIELATSEEAAQLYESWSYEAALAVKIDQAIIDARHHAIRLWRLNGRQEKVGLNLRWLARLHWYRGEAQEADKYLSEALTVLEALPPGPELAMAYAIRSQMLMLHRRRKEAITWGNRSIALARKCNATETLVHALNTVGTAKMYAGQKSGLSMLKESLALSLAGELHEQAARAYTNIASCAVQRKDFAVAETYATEGIKFDSENDLDAWTHYLVGYQAQMRLDQGRLRQARDIADGVLCLSHLTRLMRMPATIVKALALARLGEDDAIARLDEMLSDAISIGELQYVVPARLAMIEASWLKGERDRCLENIQALSELPLARLNSWNFGDVYIWFHRCGMPSAYRDRSHSRLPAARQLELGGRHREAAELLLSMQMRYDAAMTLAHAETEKVGEALTLAFRLFEEAGARSGMALVRRRATSIGMQKLLPRPKRGPYARARSHPLGLTGREVEILKFVKAGMSNREISAALHRSERTIEHHISALLGKLGVRNRIEALIRIQAEPWLLA